MHQMDVLNIMICANPKLPLIVVDIRTTYKLDCFLNYNITAFHNNMAATLFSFLSF